MRNVTRFAVLALVILMVLPLMGCDEDAALLKDAMKKSMEIESSRTSSNLSITSHMPPEEMEEELAILFSLLEKGMTMEVEMESLTTMGLEMALEEEGSLREGELWPYEASPQMNVFVDGERTAFKTAADPYYLLIDPADAMLMVPDEDVPDLGAIYDDDYMEKQTEMMMDFFLPFIEEFGFRFSKVENLGTFDLDLPDGTVETEALRLEMDLNETMDLVAYSCRQLAVSEPFKEYLRSSITLPMERMKEEGLIPEEEMPSPEEIDEMVETAFQQFSDIMLEVADMVEDPQELQDEYGLELTVIEDYYLDEDGYIRQTISSYRIQAEHEELVEILGTSRLDLEINAESVVWDINEEIIVDFPAPEEMISFYALMEDPEKGEELGEGPLYDLFQAFSQMTPLAPVGSQLIIDLEHEVFMFDGELIEMEEEPYMEDGVMMVPLRQMAEIAGGELKWRAEDLRVTYQDTGLGMILRVGGDEASINGETVQLSRPLVFVGDSAMIPAELLEYFTQQLHIQDNTIVAIF